MTAVDKDIDRLRRRPDARALNDDAVMSISESVAAVGLINPLRVRAIPGTDDFEIIAGSHRFAACDAAGLREIPCVIVSDDDRHAELAMIDENLCRAELSPADRAKQTARRKAIYLELHPETAVGENQHTRVRQVGEGSDPAQRFTENTARATGQSERVVQRDVQRGEAIVPAVLELIKGTSLDTGVYLDKLRKARPLDQMTIAKRDLAVPRQKGNQNARASQCSNDQVKPTYQQVLVAVELLAGLTAVDLNGICPPNKRAAMYQKMAHLEEVFAAARGGAE